MKKRWIPLIIACIAVAFVFGLQMGARTEAEQQGAQDAQEHVATTIAVVNADAGVYLNGIRTNYAAAIIDTLDYNFTLVSPAMAQTGLESGMYSAVVTFPSNVSARILSFNAYQPERVELEFVISPHLSDREFLETFIAITELQLAINTTLANTYVSSILYQFHYAQDHVDGVFQNNLADLLALELLTHGDFTYNLHLDYVPIIPLNARELDREFYMGQVASFAAEVAGWYLHSYEMASNQFLWMREGLFALTENFPQQKDTWLDMLTEWTRLSEEYGELLEIYSAYVRGHDLSLYEWFHENRDWNNQLEDFQWDLSNWHEDSAHWFEAWEGWHQDYLGYLDAVIEFREALDTFHDSLDESAISVIADLEQFLSVLEEYEQNLYRQFGLIAETLDLYGLAAGNANSFLEELQGWHGNLTDHYGVLAEWQGDINQRQYYMNRFRTELIDGQIETQEIIDEFMDRADELPNIPTAPLNPNIYLYDYWAAIYDKPTIPCMDHLLLLLESIRTVESDELEALNLIVPPRPTGLVLNPPNIGVLSLDNVPPAPPWDISLQSMPSVTISEPPPAFWGQDAAMYRLDVISWLETTLVPDIISQFTQEVIDELEIAANTAFSDAEDWRDLLYEAVNCPDHGWYYQLSEISGDLSEWYEDFTQLSLRFNAALIRLDEWYDDLGIFHCQMETFHGDIDDFIYYELEPWHSILHTISGVLTDWYSGLRDFVDGTYCAEDIYRIHGLAEVYTALSYFYYWLYNTEMPDLPDYEYWEALETPDEAYAGARQPFEALGGLDLPEWHEDIVAPESYRGAQIHYAFNIGFPLEEHAMAEPFGMAPPPQYTGVLQPDMVGDHTMITAFQPLNPLVGAPPRPDNFWHSLNFMHDQLSSFDVRDFLSDDVHSRVDRSLQSYDVFLASINDDITHLFSGNIQRMSNVVK